MPPDCNLASSGARILLLSTITPIHLCGSQPQSQAQSRDLSDCSFLVVEARALGLSGMFLSVATSLSQYIRHPRPAISMGCGLVLKDEIPAFHSFTAGEIPTCRGLWPPK